MRTSTRATFRRSCLAGRGGSSFHGTGKSLPHPVRILQVDVLRPHRVVEHFAFGEPFDIFCELVVGQFERLSSPIRCTRGRALGVARECAEVFHKKRSAFSTAPFEQTLKIRAL